MAAQAVPVHPRPQLRVTSPATGALVAEVPAALPDDVAPAMERARAAQPGWAALSFRTRARLLRRLVGAILRDGELTDLLVAENGKPRYEAEAIEVFYTCELTRYLTGRAGRRALAEGLRRPFVFAHKRVRVIQRPHGVVAVIGPWNWPLLNNFADCVAPLVAGNAVLLKPSPLTPLTSLRVAALWKELDLPEGVFQVLPGGGDVGAALVDTADMVFFTGSQRVGRAVARRCGERLVPCVLELGGKSPFIVLDDADLPAAARAAVWGSFANSGQVCIRPERVLVARPVADRFVELCREEMGRLRQGPGPAAAPADPGSPRAVPTQAEVTVDVGAITFPDQIGHAEAQIQDAVARGARVVAGGTRRTDLPGRFFAPTLLAGVSPEMAVAEVETFAPLLAVIPVRDGEEAVAISNRTGLGLSGSVWSRDTDRALALARRLDAGSVCVNDVLVNYFCVEAPLGGVKGSGLGFRHGPESLRQFCWPESIVEDAPGFAGITAFVNRQLFFPYQVRVLRLLRWFMRRLY